MVIVPLQLASRLIWYNIDISFFMFTGRMGRSYIVDEAVAKYLGGLQADPGSCATGLLAGQVRKLN